jgi:hypothetical protein
MMLSRLQPSLAPKSKDIIIHTISQAVTPS